MSAGPGHRLADGGDALLPQPPFDVAEFGMTGAGDVPLVSGDELIPVGLAGKQVDEQVRGSLGTAAAARQVLHAGPQGGHLGGAQMIDGRLDQHLQ
jgi:hypothetical protein